MALALRRAGRTDEAEAMLREANAYADKHFPQAIIMRAENMIALALCVADMQRKGEAQVLLEAALAIAPHEAQVIDEVADARLTIAHTDDPSD